MKLLPAGPALFVRERRSAYTRGGHGAFREIPGRLFLSPSLSLVFPPGGGRGRIRIFLKRETSIPCIGVLKMIDYSGRTERRVFSSATPRAVFRRFLKRQQKEKTGIPFIITRGEQSVPGRPRPEEGMKIKKAPPNAGGKNSGSAWGSRGKKRISGKNEQ